MGVAWRAGAGLVASLVASTVLAAMVPAYGATSAPHVAARPHTTVSAAGAKLTATIAGVGNGTIRVGKPLVVTGTVRNPGHIHWVNVKVYLQIASDPATDIESLDTLGQLAPDAGLGSTIIDAGSYDTLGVVPPGTRVPFRLVVPYAKLGLRGVPGAYRVAVKVLATGPGGRNLNDPVRTSTLMPLLPPRGHPLTPVQSMVLLPLTAPVKRLADGDFTDDSLVANLRPGGRLDNAIGWAAGAPLGTVQVVVDPALLAAVTDMSNGYRVQPLTAGARSTAGNGQQAAGDWLAQFNQVAHNQNVLLLPWGNPAANTLVAHHLSRPITAAVTASEDYLRGHSVLADVAGWLTDGRSSSATVVAMHRAGVGIQILSQQSLPGLASYRATHRPLPSQLELSLGGSPIHALVTSESVAGVVTTSSTSALQLRQRLMADAIVRSLSGLTVSITVAALPFDWNPGTSRSGQGLEKMFAQPFVVPQTVVGALDRPATPYRGTVIAGRALTRPPGPGVLTAIRRLAVSGGDLASLLTTSEAAQLSFARIFAMAGSSQWGRFPQLATGLITSQVAIDKAQLARVTLTGPPFVAMSSNSGRFPLTVTNGLPQTVTLKLSVVPEEKALSIEPIAPIQLPGGQRRDIQIVGTADRSGVTSVTARLTTTNDAAFGKPWNFDVRSTQIGLVIWVVMGVGGGVLLIAAGYRIVNRLRGRENPRRQTQV